MMKHGVDCFATIGPGVPEQLLALGYTFFARYYRRAPLEGGVGNALSRVEAQRLFSAGFWALAIYQNTSNTPAYFTRANALADAQAALGAARHHGQPQDTVIYFAVDCDISSRDIPAVLAYFRVVETLLWEAGYFTGAYGSGAVCAALSDSELVHRTWLSNARGWRDYAKWFPHADVVQTTQPFTLPFGLQVDANVCRDPQGAGMWRPDMGVEPEAPSPTHRALLSRISDAISRVFGYRGGSRD